MMLKKHRVVDKQNKTLRKHTFVLIVQLEFARVVGIKFFAQFCHDSSRSWVLRADACSSTFLLLLSIRRHH